MKPLHLLVLGALAFAGAAHAGPAEDLKVQLREGCRAATSLPDAPGVSPRDHGLIEVGTVHAALDKIYPYGRLLYHRPLPPTHPKDGDRATEESRLTAAQWLARRAYPHPDEPPVALPPQAAAGDAALREVKRLADSWFGPGLGMRLEHGGLLIVAPGKSREQVLAQLLSDDATGMQLVCRWPVREPQQKAEMNEPAWKADADWKMYLVRTPEDLDKTEITQRKFAEFAYADDRETRVQSWGVVATGAVRLPEIHLDGENSYLHVTPRFYVAYDRKGENDPNADGYVNDLTFGARLTGDFGDTTNWFGYYTVAGSIQTDDDLESEAYALEARLDPPLPLLPYHRFERVKEGRYVNTGAVWTADLVADWVHVDDPGRKTALKDAAEYFRLGYDAGFRIWVGPSRQPWKVALVTSYKVRDGQTDDGGDAQLFTSAVQFEGGDSSWFAGGLSYERGENLKSFKSSELWKLFLGLRF